MWQLVRNVILSLIISLILLISQTNCWCWIGNSHNAADDDVSTEAECTINVSTLSSGKPSPLVLNPGTATFFRASDSAGTLTFNANQNVLLACSGATNYFETHARGIRELTATCVSGTTFSVGGKKYEFNELKCKQKPVTVYRTPTTCYKGKTLIKIGFIVSTGFVEVYEACHDEGQHNTLYTKFILTKDAAGFQKGVSRPDFKKGNFFRGLDPQQLYKREEERKTFTTLLGSQLLANDAIDLDNNYFLSVGHLAAKSDFLYGSQQLATFFYINAAPQWQTFNGANWNSLESDVKKFAARTGQDLEVYTGTWGVATLPDIREVQTNLYLSKTKVMPVPRMFWKVIYNRLTQAGIAFIGLNNPYQTEAQAAADVRCTNICSQLTWLTWDATNLVDGYSYCCEVNNFRAAFPELPSFSVTSVLR